MALSSSLAFLLLAGTARASWVTVPLVWTPTDAGRYDIEVSHEENSLGGTRFVVTLRLKKDRWPMQMIPMLTKIKAEPHSLESAEKRGLAYVTHGDVRTLVFDVTKAEAAKWHFQLDEYGESNGRLMPSVTSFLFPLNRPPKAETPPAPPKLSTKRLPAKKTVV